ncbi:helix-turn-helix domain-containing protein [Amycolatopsis sp., V23-08]|uniref:Helix-turn-helix domain-containing protein n=1 Tax=Amycolatopsis heterodermiae TaxID=3110235 RepID=A0ABU5R384_9PSEU|nr:helix-turn-helix domain-containing protein [Amycolatopsis sp., V23-08]MEA5360676.1 helix-turn-helix domain-containing protein [Amycolatopsis sp., V23-08]
MRADALRNLETVLTTGARMLAADPAASIGAIAAEAGVDRRTVYRHFASRDELLAAVYDARLSAVEEAVDRARLREAPVPTALHRYAEGIIEVNRKWPVELTRMRAEPSIQDRRGRMIAEVNAFIARATEEGVFRADVPEGWVYHLLIQLLHLASRQPSSPTEAADLLVGTLLHGVGAA